MVSRKSVVLIALDGPTEQLHASVVAAAGDGLVCHVVIDEPHETSLDEVVRRLGTAEAIVGVLPIQARKVQRVRHRFRVGSARTIGALDSLIDRIFDATAHRLRLSSGTSSQVASIGERVSSAVSRLAWAVVNRLLDPLVHIVGWVIARPRETYQVVGRVVQLMKTDNVVGVVCLGSASLLPGYILARRFHDLPVVTSYPDNWAAETFAGRRLLDDEAAR